MVQSALWSTVVFGFLSLTTQGGENAGEGVLTMELGDVDSTSSPAVHQL